MPRLPDDEVPTSGTDILLYGSLDPKRAEFARKQLSELRARKDEGDWYGCYECVALDSIYVGERMVLTFGADDRERAKLGTRAPDTRTFGPGWKFTLQQKLDDPAAAIAWLHRLEEKT